MNDMDRLQEINVDFSQFIKKNLKKIKALPADKQKQFGKLLGDFKNGLDDLSESTVTEGKNDFMARGLNTNISIKNQPNADLSEKLYYALISLMKKEKFSPNEITIKF
jgi:phage-related protein